MNDQLTDDFMRAVYEIGEQKRGYAGYEEIMPRLGLEPSSVADIRKPTTEDDDLYKGLARYCEEQGYIKTIDRHRAVRITDRGRQYVECGS